MLFVVKGVSKTEEENRILRGLFNKIELEIGRTFKKKFWDRSKKDLVDIFYSKHKISKTKIIDMVGIV
jgi:hypothetical protein